MARSTRDYIDILVRMIDAAKFQRDAGKSAQAIGGIGTQAQKTGKKTSESLKSLVKWAASAYIFKRAATFLSGAVRETGDLAKQSLQLQRLTGLSVKTSSQWIIVAQQWQIEGSRLGVMFTQLGRAQQRALAGSKMQVTAFQRVGLSARDLRNENTTQIVEQISNAFAAMPDGLEKAALAQQFFGRTGRQLLPILNQGGEALQQQLDMVDKYGASLEGKTASDVKKMIAQQRELGIATMGFKEQLSDALIPTLTALSADLKIVLGFFRPLLKNQKAMRVAIISLALAWGVYTAAQIGAAIAGTTLREVMISTGIGLLIVGLGVAVLLLANNWDQLSASTSRVVAVIVQAVRNLRASIASDIHAVVAIFMWGVRKVRSAYNSIRHFGSHLLSSLNPLHSVSGLAGAFASGGTAHMAGSYLVGERGPEVVTLPQGASVTPIDTSSHEMPAPRAAEAPIVHATFQVDGRVLARATARAVSREQARR